MPEELGAALTANANMYATDSATSGIIGTSAYISPEIEKVRTVLLQCHQARCRMPCSIHAPVTPITSSPWYQLLCWPPERWPSQRPCAAMITWQGWATYDERVDIYSLGVVVFELWYPFKTGMERVEKLRALRETGTLPPGFEERRPKALSATALLSSEQIALQHYTPADWACRCAGCVPDTVDDVSQPS